MKFFNLFLVSGLAFSIAACDTKRNPYFSDDNAQFYVGSIKDDKVEEKTDEAGAIYGAKITFVACLKTLAGGGIPPRVKFEVQAGNDSIVSKTNKDGCIEWTEDHSFEPNQYERNLKLIRTFVSRNDYVGKVQHIIYWNNKSNKITTDIDTKTPPRGVEDPIEQTFTMGDAHITKQNADTLTTSQDGQQGVSQKNSTRLVLSGISLTRVKMNQETPFKVDRNLTLHAQHTYQVSATPKFYVKTFNNANEEVNLPGGKYKLTLVFMDDPGIDLEKLSQELNVHKTASSFNNAQSSEGKKLKLATELMLSKKELNPDQQLSDADKKKILTTVLLRHVHSTVQFIADKTAENDIEKYIDLQLKKLASLDVRTVLAVTVENISTGQKQKLKGHGVGYINSLLDAGAVTLFQSPIEADQLYNAYTVQRIQMDNLRPLDMYLQASTLQLKERALAPLDMKDLTKVEIRQAQFVGGYPFNAEFEAFLANKMDQPRKATFLRALCVKMLSVDQLKSIDTPSNAFRSNDRKGLIEKCMFKQLTNFKYYNVDVFDFVESVDDAKVSKVGKSVTETISVSRGFSLSESSSQSSSSSHDDWALFFGNLLIDGAIGTVSATNPIVGKALEIGVKAVKSLIPVSLGGEWYWASSAERSKSQTASISRGSAENLSINIDTYKITAETKRCAVITYEPWLIKYFAEQEKVQVRKGFIACAAKTIRPTYTEKYYMVTQECSEKNGTTDCASDEENKLRIMMRGEPVYQQFNEMMVNTKLNILLDPIQPDALEKQRTEWKSLMDAALMSQVFPGAFIPVMN